MNENTEMEEVIYVKLTRCPGCQTCSFERDHYFEEKLDYNPEQIKEELEAEVKRLKDNINILIMKWAPLSEHTRDTLKVKVVLAALEDVLTSENYYAGE